MNADLNRGFITCLVVLFLSLIFFPGTGQALSSATVTSSVTSTPQCQVFESGEIDYGVKLGSGIFLYSGTLTSASWSSIGSLTGLLYPANARNVRCSRDAAGVTHVVHNLYGVPVSDNFIRYFSFDASGTAASASTISGTDGFTTPLEALSDSSGNLFVLFSGGSVGNEYYIAYRDAATTNWTIYDVDVSGDIRAADMVLADDLPVVALYDESTKDVVISRADAALTSWTNETALTTTAATRSSTGDYLALAEDGNGDLHVVFMDGGGAASTLGYATDASGSWSSETVTSSASYNNLVDISAVTPNLVVAAAYSTGTGGIVYFVRDGSVWSAAASVAASKTTYLEIGADDGDFAISYLDSSSNLQVAYTLCGDGVADAFEECDDGNSDDADSCSNTCQDTCGDGTVQGSESCDDGNTVDNDGCSGICKLEACGDAVLQTGEECDDGNLRGGDGCSSDCTIETCGNGAVDFGEFCDDGNAVDADSCVACQSARCNDGFVWSTDGGAETCDDGNNTADDGCSPSCGTEVCGDGIPQSAEACDDGNTDNTDGCTTLCLVAACGDGYEQLGEQCDDGNVTDTDACPSICRDAVCGDGYLWSAGGEVCDDGNMNNGDGCGSDCLVEHAPVVSAGIDQTVSWPASDPAPTVNLSGTASDEDTDAVLTYRWIVLRKPAGSALVNTSIADRTTLTPSFRPDVRGPYQFRLTVVDNDFYLVRDTVDVTIR